MSRCQLKSLHLSARAVVRTACALVLVLLVACGEQTLPEGVVATVNGASISLRELEAVHDVSFLGWTGAQGPSVEELQKQYGMVLSELIVQKLIEQELTRLGHAVTDGDVAAAEGEVRADYPDGTFDRALVEESIDLAQWRNQLRRRLALEKLATSVLRPEIAIPLADVESYFTRYEKQFQLPRRMRVLLVVGADKTVVEKARGMLAAGTAPETLGASVPQVTVQELKMHHDRLPAVWQKDLGALTVRQASQVRSMDGAFQCLVRLADVPERSLTLTEAYPLIEQLLVEQKMDEAFDRWLAGVVAKAQIRITPQLSRPLPPEKGAVLPPPAANATDR